MTDAAAAMPPALKSAAAAKKEKNQHIQVVVRCRSDSWNWMSLWSLVV